MSNLGTARGFCRELGLLLCRRDPAAPAAGRGLGCPEQSGWGWKLLRAAKRFGFCSERSAPGENFQHLRFFLAYL